MAANDEPPDPAEGDAAPGPIDGDPWRGLDDEPAVNGDDDAGFALSSDDADSPFSGERTVPTLTVFPPADHDPGPSDTEPDVDLPGEADRPAGVPDDLGGRGRSAPIVHIDDAGFGGQLGVAAQGDEASFAGAGDDVSFAGLEAGGDTPDGELPFDDVSADGEGFGEGSLLAGRGPAVFVPDDPGGDAGSTVLGDEVGPDGVPVGESASESALFSAVVEESTVFDGSATGSESFSGDSQGIGDGAALAAELAAVTVAAGARPRPGVGRAAEAWPRQVAHIVLGGVLAIPVAYSILLWGFQKDPFKIAAALPEGVRSLLPARVRSGRAPSRMPSLDRLPSPGSDPPAVDAGAALPSFAPETEVTASADAEAVALPLHESGQDAATPSAVEAPVMQARITEAAVTQPPGGGLEPPRLEESFASPLVSVPPADFGVPPPAEPGPTPALAADPSATDGGAVGITDGSLAIAIPPAVDRDALAAAVDRLCDAGTSLDDADHGAADRESLLVVWYRALALAAERLVRLEKQAADAGVPLESPHRELTRATFGRADGPRAVEDLRVLGAMWMESRRRDSEGCVVVGRLDGTAEYGAGWSSQVSLSDAGADAGAEPRRLVVVSRRMPAAEVGDTVLVAGVIIADRVVWAADVWTGDP